MAAVVMMVGLSSVTSFLEVRRELADCFLFGRTGAGWAAGLLLLLGCRSDGWI